MKTIHRNTNCTEMQPTKSKEKIISYVRFSKTTQAFIYLINVHRLYLIMCNIWIGNLYTLYIYTGKLRVAVFALLCQHILNLRPHFYTWTSSTCAPPKPPSQNVSGFPFVVSDVHFFSVPFPEVTERPCTHTSGVNVKLHVIAYIKYTAQILGHYP